MYKTEEEYKAAEEAFDKETRDAKEWRAAQEAATKAHKEATQAYYAALREANKVLDEARRVYEGNDDE